MKRLFLFLSVLLCIFLITESMADVVNITVTDMIASGREGEVFSRSTADEFWTEEGSSTFYSIMDTNLYKLQYTTINGEPIAKSTSVMLNHADYIGVSSISIVFMWKQRTDVQPPADDPPADDPPAEDPPSDDPPADNPPTEPDGNQDNPQGSQGDQSDEQDPVIPDNPEPVIQDPVIPDNQDPVIPDHVIQDPVISDPVVEPEVQTETKTEEKKEDKKEEKQKEPDPVVIVSVPESPVNEQPITYSTPDFVEVYVESTPTPTPKKSSKKKKKAKATPTPVVEKTYVITILDENMRPITPSVRTDSIGSDGMMVWMEEANAYLAVEVR